MILGSLRRKNREEVFSADEDSDPPVLVTQISVRTLKSVFQFEFDLRNGFTCLTLHSRKVNQSAYNRITFFVNLQIW